MRTREGDKEAKRNLYEKYGDRHTCNEPLISKEKREYMEKHRLLDSCVQEGGSLRVSINTTRAKRHSMKIFLESLKEQIHHIKQEEKRKNS